MTFNLFRRRKKPESIRAVIDRATHVRSAEIAWPPDPYPPLSEEEEDALDEEIRQEQLRRRGR